MATVTASDGKSVSDKEKIEALIRLGESEADAVFIVALERAEVDGDIMVIDDGGHATGPARSQSFFLGNQ